MNTYTELNKKLSELLFAKKSRLTLSSILESYQKLNLPHIPFIHVAGTNGKGSVVEKISQVLTLSGYRCGKYTSPHLFSFRERIQVDGQPITPQEIELYLPPLLERFKDLTFFEITTLLALVYFAEKKVDVAVIEVGLGGRLDATNCITPLLSIITSIGWDHQHILGNTLEKIAFEKGGIIKEKVPVLLGPTSTQKILKELAEDKKAPLVQVEGTFPSYDEENKAIAKKALELLTSSFTLDEKVIEKGLKAKPPCRQEAYEFEKHDILFDMSHNPPGMEYLFKSIKASHPHRPIYALVSFSQGHDANYLADYIHEQCDKVYLLKLKHPKLLQEEELKRCFSSCDGLLEPGQIRAFMEKAPLEPLYLFVGSLFMMQEVKEALGDQSVKDPYLIQDGSFNFR